MAGARVGGAEAFFERLAIAFARTGIEQRVAIRRHADRARRLREGGVDVVELGFRGRLDLATRWRLASELARFAPDVLVTWMSRASAAVPPRSLTGGRCVHVGRLGGYYDLKNFRRCDWLVANTGELRDWIVARGWPAGRVAVLPNFVDATAAAPAPRAALATPDGVPVALALGRLHENKAFDVLLDAAARVPRLVVWLAGEGPQGEALRAQADRLGIGERVRFLGWREDVAALLAAADLLVCPSRREPLGNVVIEAWAHRRPVVAAASAGPSQLIRDGVDGLLAPVDDAAALADAIARVVGEPGRGAALAAAGRAAYEAEFTEDAVVGRWLEFLARVAGKS
jgi:glycosyltransferase involved in cell wall biosynthesis